MKNNFKIGDTVRFKKEFLEPGSWYSGLVNSSTKGMLRNGIVVKNIDPISGCIMVELEDKINTFHSRIFEYAAPISVSLEGSRKIEFVL